MNKKPRPKTKRTTTRSVLRPPDLEHAKAAVLNSLTSRDAQRDGLEDPLKTYLGDRQSGRVFQTKHDTPLVVNNVNRHVLKPLCKKLGIPIGTTHAFRHGRISVLQQNNVPGDLIKKWVGHTSLKTTSKYTHFPTEYRRKVVSELAKNA
jgi:integrase